MIDWRDDEIGRAIEAREDGYLDRLEEEENARPHKHCAVCGESDAEVTFSDPHSDYCDDCIGMAVEHLSDAVTALLEDLDRFKARNEAEWLMNDAYEWYFARKYREEK